MLDRRGTRLTRHRLHHSGTRPVRVLLIADLAHLLAFDGGATLEQRTVDRIWLATRRGVDLDVLADLTPVLDRVAHASDDWRLWRYAVVVVAVDPGVGARRRVRALQQVRDLLVADAEHGTPVVLVVPDAAGSGLEERLHREAAAAGGDALRVVRVVDAGRQDLLKTWAARIGEAVELLVARAPSVHVTGPDDEAARQAALDATGLVGRAPDARLDDLAELARTAFGTASAEINFLDHDRQWKAAVAGAERRPGLRAHSFCSETITRDEPLVVADARLDPVLRRSPLVHGPNPIRFYAAHPIESLDGYRIGSFCVYDPEPRDVRGLDLAVLRDLALLVQAELYAQDAGPRGASDRLQPR